MSRPYNLTDIQIAALRAVEPTDDAGVAFCSFVVATSGRERRDALDTLRALGLVESYTITDAGKAALAACGTSVVAL